MGTTPDMRIYFDGACEPINPGGVATWGFVYLTEGAIAHRAHGIIGEGPGMTNNLAEYTALIEALRWAYKTGLRGFAVYGDSQLVVNQVAGNWQVKAPHLRPLAETARKGMRHCEVASLSWIRREQNTAADTESRNAYLSHARGGGANPKKGRL